MRKTLLGHLEWLRTQPCLACGNNTGAEAAHVRSPDPYLGKRLTGTGTKPDDFWTVPLCSACHRKQHEVGEKKFWGALGIDAPVVALALYAHTGDQDAADLVYRQWRTG